MRAVLLSVLVVLAWPAGASAVEIVNPDGSRAEPFQAWADRAKVPTPTQRITLHLNLTGCGDWTWAGSMLGGCTDRTANVWLRPRGCSARATRRYNVCRFLLLHELAHVFDEDRMTDADRDAFRDRLALTEDWHYHGAYGRQPEELFANTYAMCALGRRVDSVDIPTREGPATESIEPRLSARNFRAICAMIRAKENPADQ